MVSSQWLGVLNKCIAVPFTEANEYGVIISSMNYYFIIVSMTEDEIR